MFETNKDIAFNDLPLVAEFNKVLDENKVNLELAKENISQIQEDIVAVNTDIKKN